MRHTRMATLIVLLLTVLLGAGCSSVVAGHAAPVPGAARSTGAPPSSATGSSTDGVAWADQVCAAFLDIHRVLSDQPKPDLTNQAATLDAYKQYFSRTVPALDGAANQLSAIGPGPLNGGEQLITNMVALVTLMRDAYRDAQTAVDAIDPASPTVMSQELPAALNLTDVKARAPQIDISATPELNAAAQAAPNCRAVGG